MLNITVGNDTYTAMKSDELTTLKKQVSDLNRLLNPEEVVEPQEFYGFRILHDQPWQIRDAVQDGTYRQKYKVGDLFPIHWNFSEEKREVDSYMQIAGIDCEMDGRGGLSLVSLDVVADHMIDENGSEFLDSEMNRYLNSEVYKAMPFEWQFVATDGVMKQFTFRDGGDGQYMTTMFIPSREEVFDGKYPLFNDIRNRVKFDRDMEYSRFWWLRSVCYATRFSIVLDNGTIANGGVCALRGVVPGFCILT